MSECICSSCKNLKSSLTQTDLHEDAIDMNNLDDEYTCEFGFPDESCYDCTVDGCELECSHYISERTEEVSLFATCSSCGKELKVLSESDDDVYCIDCYLSR